MRSVPGEISERVVRRSTWPCSHLRTRDLGELDFAGCEVLKDLPHGAGFSSTAKIFARKFASAANRFTTRSYVSPATKRALEATP